MDEPAPFMPWNPDFETGIPEVDRQHRHLVGLLNRAARCMDEARQWEVEGLFDELRAYADYHFREEEILLARTGYPDLAAHQREHQGFVHHLTALYAAYLSQSGGGAMELTGFLRAWLESHILTSDQAYVAHVRQAG